MIIEEFIAKINIGYRSDSDGSNNFFLISFYFVRILIKQRYHYGPVGSNTDSGAKIRV